MYRKTALFFLLFSFVIALCACSEKVNNISPTPPPSDTAQSGTVSTPEPTPEPVYTDIVINEVMPSNGAVLLNSYGEFSDWIEIYNAGERDASLSGYYLSDDPENLLKWQMPAYELKAGEYALIFASGRDSTESEIHAPFKLSKEGEDLFITSADCTIISTLSFKNAEKNISVGWDGKAYRYPTPGYSNDDAGYEALQLSRKMPSGLVITEAMNANSKYVPHDGTHSDWVELYNNSDTAIQLSDCFLTDDVKSPEKSRLPDVTLEPHAYCTIYCDDYDTHYKSYVTGFSLGSEDDVFLMRNGEVIDFISLHDIPYGASFGRMSDNGFYYFTSPTPARDNKNGVRMVADMPVVSVPQGVYNNAQSFETAIDGEGEIYYTTDGSEPTRYSTRYTSPVKVEKTSVIRAIAYVEGKLDSRIMTASYIINENHVLPVLSLTTDEDNLFDPETGIYVEGNHQNYYQDWEKPCNLTLFENGETRFCEDCGLKMFGSGSRADCDKKSMRVNFKAKYGTSKLKCDVFDDGITGYKSLVMRAGEDAPYTIFRNEVFTTLAKKTNLLVQNNKYCVLYIDGEYFGIYCLCERFSASYYAQHHDIDENLVTVYEAPTSSDSPAGKLMKYVQSHDMTTAENYKYVDRRLDLTGMIDWFIMQAYSHNRDISGNLRYFYRADRDFTEYSFYDLDWAFYKYNDRYDILDDGQQYSIIIHALLKNTEFRERFIKRNAELLNGVLRDSNVLKTIEYYEELIRPEIARERKKWSGTPEEPSTAESWQRAVDRMKKYVTSRSIKEEMIQSLRSHIGLTEEEAARIRG